MKRLLVVCALLLCGLPAGCKPPFAIFEDVGSDPHPPQVKLLGIAFQPEEPAEGEPPAVPDLKPADGFVVRPFKEGETSLLLRVEYADTGGDVQIFVVRDRDSSLNSEVSPSAPDVDLDGDGVADTLETPDFFSGTRGTVDLEKVEIGTKMLGTHRMEIWAEDSHGSRSEKVEFTIEVSL